MKYAKFKALRMIKIPPKCKRFLWDTCLIALFIATWGLISISPWWYPSDMTPLQILGVGAAIFAVAFILTSIVQWAFRRLKRPMKRRKVKITYDSRGGRCDRERLGYVSAETICEIGRRCTK